MLPVCPQASVPLACGRVVGPAAQKHCVCFVIFVELFENCETTCWFEIRAHPLYFWLEPWTRCSSFTTTTLLTSAAWTQRWEERRGAACELWDDFISLVLVKAPQEFPPNISHCKIALGQSDHRKHRWPPRHNVIWLLKPLVDVAWETFEHIFIVKAACCLSGNSLPETLGSFGTEAVTEYE